MTGFTLPPLPGYSKLSRAPRDLALLFLAVAACSLPFLDQPFHMDDSFYMDMARNALQKPLFPNDLPYRFHGESLPDMGSHSHPPLQTYFLALLQALFGEREGREWIYHLAALPFPLLAAFSFYFLAARFLGRPLWPALVLAGSPVFMVMGHNLMTDLPNLAWWLAAIAAFAYASDRRSRSLFAASAVFQTAAVFTSYLSLALTPLLGFYQIRKRGGPAGWLALALPPAAMAGWLWLNYLHYGRMILGDTVGYVQSRHALSAEALWTKMLALLQYQGWLVVFPLFLLAVFARGHKGRVAAVGALAAVYAARLVVPEYGFVEQILFAIGLAAGGAVMVQMAVMAAKAVLGGEGIPEFHGLPGQFLGLWYFGVAAGCLLVFTEGSARYILPLVPPVLICFFRTLELAEVGEYRRASPPLFSVSMVASGTLIVTLAWGLLLSHADLEAARVYRQAALEAERVTRGFKTWFGGEWGFRYYARSRGAELLPADETRVEGGSYIVRPRMALPYEIPAGLDSMTAHVQTLALAPRTPLRLLDEKTPAGFYSTGWGLLPFTLSWRNLEEVDIRQVSFLLERLPWAEIESRDPHSPWAAFAEIRGRRRPALMARAGTRIRYEWIAETPVVIELMCGIAPGGAGGADGEYFCRAAQLDALQRVVDSAGCRLAPDAAGGRDWKPLRLTLQPAQNERLYLELFFDGAGDAAGIFAESVLAEVK